MLTVGLKDDYNEYDISRPIILSDVEEVLQNPEYSLQHLHSFHMSFESLKRLVPENEKFVSEAVASKTRFGDYDVIMGIFSAKNYNDFLGKLINRIAQHTTQDTQAINQR